MRIAILTFDGFNEIDSFVALNILNRVRLPGWKAEIVAPSTTVTSMNGVVVRAQRALTFVRGADAVVFGSGRQTRELVEDQSLLEGLVLDPSRQLVGSQCSGALFLHRLNLLQGAAVCTDNVTRPFLDAAGITTLQRHFNAQGNIATAGGCLAAPCLAAWIVRRLAGEAEAVDALRYVAPVGREEAFIQDVLWATKPVAPEAVEAAPNQALQPTR